MSRLCRASGFAMLLALLVLTSPASAQLRGILGITTSTLPTFQLNANPTAAQTLTITTRYWGLSTDTLYVCVGMTASMTGSSPSNLDVIPASKVEAMGENITTWTSIGSGTGCGASPAREVWHGDVVGWFGTSRDDSIQVRIRNYDSPTPLQADTYTGTITVYAGFY